MNYLTYNREERDLCAHLFRLLLEDQPHWGPLRHFIGTDIVDNPRIFCEVALIRDAYYERKERKDHKDDAQEFLSNLCDLIASQELGNEEVYTKFADLPESIRDPKQTHPKQIKYKLDELGLLTNLADRNVYGALQGMFNAKPDLAICTGKKLLIYEAKYTCGFDEAQLQRTRNIGNVWAKLLYKDLGIDEQPEIEVYKQGMKRDQPDVSWEKVYMIAQEYWGMDNFSSRVLSKVRNMIDCEIP